MVVVNKRIVLLTRTLMKVAIVHKLSLYLCAYQKGRHFKFTKDCMDAVYFLQKNTVVALPHYVVRPRMWPSHHRHNLGYISLPKTFIFYAQPFASVGMKTTLGLVWSKL